MVQWICGGCLRGCSSRFPLGASCRRATRALSRREKSRHDFTNFQWS
ncbi:unnamed protein product [Plutella xylostella]|uniref:(diamondback moth) hypothetical protein n=1 Tax=Plutella xylostella TaxID=51655 RepID=A0A8S4EFP7_PLUXY|nr:unnamed protein product [Plutella xylostella]